MQTIDFGTDADAFWKAYQGKRRPRRKRTTTTTTTRAARGEGSRQKDLSTLARAGFTTTHQQHGEFWLSSGDGSAETPRCDSYKAALDAALTQIAHD